MSNVAHTKQKIIFTLIFMLFKLQILEIKPLSNKAPLLINYFKKMCNTDNYEQIPLQRRKSKISDTL